MAALGVTALWRTTAFAKTVTQKIFVEIYIEFCARIFDLKGNTATVCIETFVLV